MSWQEELRNGIRTAQELGPVLGWSPEEIQRRAEILERFPMVVSAFYPAPVDPAEPHYPL